MVKLVDDLNFYDLSSFEEDIFFHRIRSDFSVIGRFPENLFYVCESDNGITAVLSKIGGTVTISAKDSADFEELNEFVQMVGFSTILCDAQFSCCFDGKKKSGKIMKIKSDERFESSAEILDAQELKAAYPILEKCFKNLPDFSHWFVNTCYGVTHNSVIFSGIHCEKELVSVAFTLFVTDKTAVLSGVATLPSYRNRGYAMEIVKKLLDVNRGKDIYLFLENPIIEEYYAQLGFTPYKMWSEIENVL